MACVYTLSMCLIPILFLYSNTLIAWGLNRRPVGGWGVRGTGVPRAGYFKAPGSDSSLLSGWFGSVLVGAGPYITCFIFFPFLSV